MLPFEFYFAVQIAAWSTFSQTFLNVTDPGAPGPRNGNEVFIKQTLFKATYGAVKAPRPTALKAEWITAAQWTVSDPEPFIH